MSAIKQYLHRLATGFILLGLALVLLQGSAMAGSREIKIGVLANNGNGTALNAWHRHADYLEKAIPGVHFKVVPLDFAALYPAVRNGLIDFVIVNTGQYVELEAETGITRIATLKNKGPSGDYTVFGGVLLTRSDRSDINTLDDVSGKRVWVPDTTSFGGWLMQLRELQAAGVSPSQFSEFRTTDCHEEVVRAVLSGKADVGAVRTGILEGMAMAGRLDLKQIKIINEQKDHGFPFLHSTRLYPEWSFSKLRQTDDRLAEQVAVALLSMPARHPAAVAAGIGGWTIAADYSTAHDLYRELKLGPYRNLGRFNLYDVIKRYWPLVALAALLLVALATATLLVVRTNRKLAATLTDLEHQRQTTQWALDHLNEQTVQLEQTNEELQAINNQMIETNHEREQLVETVRRNEEQLRLLLDSTAEAIYGTDLNGICTFCNTACLRMLGYSDPGQLIGKNMHQQIHHTHRDGSHFPEQTCRITQSFKKGEGIHVDDEVFWRADGSCFPVEYWSYPQHQDGVIVGTVATFMDITERVKSQANLLMLSRAVENSPAIVVITDHEGSIEYVNSKFSEITGFTTDEAVGQNPRILNAGVQSKGFYKEMWDTINNGQEWRGEFCNRKKNGEMHWEHASISPIRDDRGRIAHFVAVKEDVTESRRIAEELQRAKEEAEAGNRSKSEFLANMSHEIRTPLNAIIGFNTLALETSLNEKQHDYLSRVNFAATSLLRIINEILDFSKIEAGKLELEQAVFSPRDVLQNIINLFQQQAINKGLTITLQCAENLPELLVGDSVRLGQVLVNLVGNAIKFTDQGTVSLSVVPTEYRCEQITLEFTVRDTGIGLSSDKLAKLFQPFTQADGSITRKFGGTGLGLSISKRIVELTGGQIWVQSEAGQGSIFAFSMPFNFPPAGSTAAHQCSFSTVQAPQLPVPSPHAAQIHSPSSAAQTEDLSGVRILLVEDNEMNRTLTIELLGRRGALLDIAVNGCEALTKILHEAAPYDVILMDLQMPGMDGYEATRKIRADLRFSSLPIIAVTAHAMLEEKQRCLELGMNGYLTKPLNALEMVRLIKETVSTRGTHSSMAALPQPQKELLEIPGLNTAEALERIDDDQALYLWLLRAFVEKHTNAAQDISASYARGDKLTARRRVHTVRGLSGTIGAEALLAESEQLEQLLSCGADQGRVTEQLAVFEQALHELISTLRKALNLPDAACASVGATEFDLERMQVVISRLEEYLRNHDSSAGRYLQEYCSELVAIPSAELKRLQYLLENYDYDTALEQLLSISIRFGITMPDQADLQDGTY